MRVELRITGAAAAAAAAASAAPLPAGAQRRPRLGREDVAAALAAAAAAAVGRAADVTTFLCGPPAMTDAMEGHLLALEQPRERIRLERWW